MIVHGNKQISEMVYARRASEGGGAVRLTNMIRGPQVVFGGLKPFSVGWLYAATVQAIRGAFGDDGYAVIVATNQYLNGIAASDPTKATALAALINEDPMMVCSLGLSVEGVTMPKRWLVGDGKVWFETGITTEYRKMSFEVGAALTRALSGEYEMFGNYSGSNSGLTAGHYNTNRVFMYASGGNSNVAVSDLQAYHLYKFVINADQGIFSTDCDGTTANISKAYNLYARNTTIKFMDGQSFNLNKGYYQFTHFDMTYGDSGHKHFVPFKHKDGDNVIPCMLDIEGCQLYYNQGTGTPTIPDISYPPSTP